MQFSMAGRRLLGGLLVTSIAGLIPGSAAFAQQTEGLRPVRLTVLTQQGETPPEAPATDEATDEEEGEAEAAPAGENEEVEGLPLLPETTVVPPAGQATRSDASRSPLPAAGEAAVPVPAQVSPQGSGSGGGTGGLDPGTVVTADRTATAAANVGSSMTVISREAIRNSGQTNVADILRTVPGLDVVTLGGPGQQTSVFMRGADSDQTKVLLDGLPINDVGSPSRAFDFSFLSIDQVERIEVLRGPQSTLYGSDAIGGVINIITRRGGPPQTTFRSEGGSFSTSRTALNHSGGSEELFYSIGGSYLDTNGFSAAGRPPGNVEDDFHRNGTLSGRLGWDPYEGLQFDLIARYNDVDTGTDGFPAPLFRLQDDPSSLETETVFVRGSGTMELFDGIWTHRFGSGYTEYQRQSFSDFPNTFYGRTGRLDWRNDLKLWEGDRFRWTASSGIDFNEEVARNNSIPNVRQGNLAGYVQTAVDVGDRLFLTAGSRWDDYSRAGAAFTYRLTGRYELPETASALHAALGTGFRAPALNELFGLVGNANLQSERSKGWEVGWQQRLLDDRLTLDATYFRNDFSDLIVFDPAPAVGFPFGQLRNVNNALASGVELTSVWALTDESTAFANYTFTDTLDRTTDTQLLRRPRDKWSFGISRTFPNQRANVSLQTLYVGPRLGVGERMDEYWLVNLASWYRVNEVWRAFGRVDNLLDEDFEPAVGFQGTPASVFAGLEATY